MEILSDIGVDVSLEPAEENDPQIASISCEIGAIVFWCYLLMQEPFFESIKLYSARFDADNPLIFANEFNNGIRTARATVVIDEDGLIKIDGDGDSSMMAQADVHFAGGVTKEHMKFVLEMWIEDLFDFHEIASDEDEDEDELQEVPELEDLVDVTVLVQITACLSGERLMTSREIARLLEVDRQLVNSVLYKERDRFENDGEQPPRWSLKAQS